MATLACIGRPSHEGFGATVIDANGPRHLVGALAVSLPAAIIAVPAATVVVLTGPLLALGLSDWADQRRAASAATPSARPTTHARRRAPRRRRRVVASVASGRYRSSTGGCSRGRSRDVWRSRDAARRAGRKAARGHLRATHARPGRRGARDRAAERLRRTSPNAPETQSCLDVPCIETPGEGYVADLNAALNDDRLSQPVLTVAADLPLLDGEIVDRVLDEHNGGSLTVLVPASLKRALGVSDDTTFDNGGREVAPTGVNVVSDGPDDAWLRGTDASRSTSTRSLTRAWLSNGCNDVGRRPNAAKPSPHRPP